MKSIFQTQFFWIIGAILGIYLGFKVIKKPRIAPIVIDELENLQPGDPIPGNFDGLTDNQVDKLIEAGLAIALGGGAITGRAIGDKSIHTPKGLPGQDKPEQVIMSDDGHIDIL